MRTQVENIVLLISHCNYHVVKIMIPRDDKYLKSLQRFGYCATFFVGLFSFALFHFEKNITKFIKSTDICENEFAYKAINWILPKTTSHCDLILTTLYWHTYAEIGIIWDLWLFAVYICSAILAFHFFLVMHARRKNEVYGFVAEHRKKFIAIWLLGFCAFVLPVYHVFFDFPFLDVEKKTRHPSWLFMQMDRYGIHASVEALGVAYLSYIGFSRWLFLLVAILKNQKTDINGEVL